MRTGNFLSENSDRQGVADSGRGLLGYDTV